MRALPLVLVVLLTAIGSFLPLDPESLDFTARLAGPSAGHPLGTDHLGRDLAARLVAGGASALAMVLATAALGLVGGTALGAAAAYAPRPAAGILVWAIAFGLAVPGLLAALVFSVAISPPHLAAGLALGLSNVAGTAQVARTLIEQDRVRLHITAAEALGATSGRILRRHILPGVFPTLILLQAYHAARTVLAWSSLTFLGLGGDTSRPDWGTMVWDYRLFLFDHPLLPLAPGVAIGVLAWGFARFGDPATDLSETVSRDRP